MAVEDVHVALVEGLQEEGNSSKALSDGGESSKDPFASIAAVTTPVVVEADFTTKINRQELLSSMIAKKAHRLHTTAGNVVSPTGPILSNSPSTATIEASTPKVNINMQAVLTQVRTHKGRQPTFTLDSFTQLPTKESLDPASSSSSVIDKRAPPINMQAVLSQITAQNGKPTNRTKSNRISVIMMEAPKSNMQALLYELAAKNRSRSTFGVESTTANPSIARENGGGVYSEHVEPLGNSKNSKAPIDRTAALVSSSHSVQSSRVTPSSSLSSSSSLVSNTGLSIIAGSSTEEDSDCGKIELTPIAIVAGRRLADSTQPSADPMVTTTNSAGSAMSSTTTGSVIKKDKKKRLSMILKKLIPQSYRRSSNSAATDSIENADDDNDAPTASSLPVHMGLDAFPAIQHCPQTRVSSEPVMDSTAVASASVPSTVVNMHIDSMGSGIMDSEVILNNTMDSEDMFNETMDGEDMFNEGDDDELQLALKLSLGEMTPLGRGLNSEKMHLATALVLSKKENSKRDVVFIPKNVFPLMKALKGHFALQLGVQINLSNISNEDILEVRHLAGDTDALSIATAQLNHYAQNYRELKALEQELLLQNVHVYVDSSHIYPAEMEDVERILRINSASLSGLLINCRKCADQIVFGTTEVSSSSSSASSTAGGSHWKRWQVGGFEVKLVDPDSSTPVSMLDTMDKVIKKNVSNCRTPPHPQRTLVVVSSNSAFVRSCGIALENGWKVELWCWRGTSDPAYFSLQDFISSGQLRVFHLDLYRDLLFYKTM